MEIYSSCTTNVYHAVYCWNLFIALSALLIHFTKHHRHDFAIVQQLKKEVRHYKVK